jgi:hypothetical protein
MQALLAAPALLEQGARRGLSSRLRPELSLRLPARPVGLRGMRVLAVLIAVNLLNCPRDGFPYLVARAQGPQ